MVGYFQLGRRCRKSGSTPWGRWRGQGGGIGEIRVKLGSWGRKVKLVPNREGSEGGGVVPGTAREQHKEDCHRKCPV